MISGGAGLEAQQGHAGILGLARRAPVRESRMVQLSESELWS